MLSTPPNDIELAIARADRTRRHGDGFETGTAQSVNGRPTHLHRQPRQQSGHSRNVAVVLAGLIGTAENNIVEACPIQLRMSSHQRRNRGRSKVVGADTRERARIATDRRANGVADESILSHGHNLARLMKRKPGQRPATQQWRIPVAILAVDSGESVDHSGDAG